LASRLRIGSSYFEPDTTYMGICYVIPMASGAGTKSKRSLPGTAAQSLRLQVLRQISVAFLCLEYRTEDENQPQAQELQPEIPSSLPDQPLLC